MVAGQSTPNANRLQRKCASCGGSGGTCSRCAQGGHDLQRKAKTDSETHTPHDSAPPVVHSVLNSASGKPLPPSTREFMESRFDQDFEKVQVHTDAKAAQSAQAVDARAYTVGHNIVFGSGQYSPDSSEGRHLLAHELAHVTQQRSMGSGAQSALTVGPPGDAYEREADRVASQVVNQRPEPLGSLSRGSSLNGHQSGKARFGRSSPGGLAVGGLPQQAGVRGGKSRLARRKTKLNAPAGVVRRVPAGEAIARFFGGGTFSDDELIEYLKFIDTNNKIEDTIESDNKARAIVDKWKTGASQFVLSARRSILMIKEMQEGATFDEDEQAILEILERSSNAALGEIFGSNGIAPNDLNSDFDGEEFDRLQDFYDRRLGGRKNALAGKITPGGEPVPLGTALGKAAKPEATKEEESETCTIKEPEKCPTYEGWLSLFTSLPTYGSKVTGHQVLGPGPAPAATATDPKADPSVRRPTVLHRSGEYMSTDRFIDGPTDKWVRDTLPANLVETAYQLPSDCADIAVILRHVWLAAHKRVELYNGWVCGSKKGTARSKDISELIIMEVFTGSVKGIVNPYSDETGSPVLSFEVLQHIIHPGDVLVWKHPGSGGHTHTIMNIVRNKQGKVTQITGLQGNQPVSKDVAESMREKDLEAQKKDPKKKLNTPTVDELREAPGRRIEVDDVELGDVNNVWSWSDGTVLVAAGPPAAAPRPKPVAKKKGEKAVRGLTDWVEPLQKATFDNLESTLESALLEARATIESKKAVSDEDAKALGQAAGQRLKELTTKAGDLGSETQYHRLKRMRAQIKALRDASHAPETKKVFDLIDEALHLSARGIASVDFNRTTKEGERVVNMLLTGFDPFNLKDPSKPPRTGDWNPSGAAVLALDNETIDVDKKLKAAVEGVVLPVSYKEFDKGLVESIVKQHKNADAVITVSLDPNIPTAGLIDIEQFAVGVHLLDNGNLEAVPGTPVAQQTGPAIIETDAEKAGPTKDEAKAEGFGFTTGTDVVFEFANKDIADAALAALKLKPAGTAEVTISDVTALREIIKTTSRDVSPKSPGIVFKAGGQTFSAYIKGGPGGSYLSNEVSYRVLRLLVESAGTNRPPSFHVHTPSGTEGSVEIPKDEGTIESEKAREKVVAKAQTMLTKLTDTLRKLIKVVARKLTTTGGKPSTTGDEAGKK